ncbi:MAG: hypothetical protein ACOCUW_01225 [Gemmatimonadota bacterium]
MRPPTRTEEREALELKAAEALADAVHDLTRATNRLTQAKGAAADAAVRLQDAAVAIPRAERLYHSAALLRDRIRQDELIADALLAATEELERGLDTTYEPEEEL